MSNERATISRRDLLSLIGAVSGSAAMYHAMTSLGFASDSGYKGPIKLDGDPKGTSVLILGAGLAGMTAALELREAGYQVQILEFNSRAGGRNWTLRGGDSFTELGGFKQTCECDQGVRRCSPAHPRHQDRFPGTDLGTACQGNPTGQAGRSRLERGSRDPDAGAEVMGRAGQQLRVQGQSHFR